MTEALNDPDDRTEAATALRGLIDKIVLTPGAKRGEISAELFGNLETVLAWAHDREDKKRKAVGGFPWEVEGSLSVSVGARTCSEDPSFSRAGVRLRNRDVAAPRIVLFAAAAGILRTSPRMTGERDGRRPCSAYRDQSPGISKP